MRTYSWIAALILTAIIGTIVLFRPHAKEPVAAKPMVNRLPPVEPPRLHLGMTSCAATGCHHGNGAAGAKGSEFTTFEALDPHANLGAVLAEERSLTMVRRVLGPAADPPATQPHCLRCHSGLQPPHELPAPAEMLMQTSIGCEMCHGPAARWREAHYAPTWGQQGAAEKIKLGMYPLWDVGARARLCAGCHIGQAGAVITHDWIAAGHPPLHFELASFFGRLPRHWQKDRDELGKPIDATALWHLGQLESARAAFVVLSAQAGNPAAPWPEFSQLDCSSCHRDLSGRVVNRPERMNPKAGPFRPGAWHTQLLDQVLATQPAEGARVPLFKEKLHRLELELTRAIPDRKVVVELAGELGDALPSHVVMPRNTWGLVASLARVDRQAPLSVNSAAQRFLAFSAWLPTLPDVKEDVRQSLDRSLNRLGDAVGTDNPARSRRPGGKTVRLFSPEAALGALDELANLAEKGPAKKNLED